MRDSCFIPSRLGADFESHHFVRSPRRMNNATMALLALLLFGCCLLAPTACSQSLPVFVFGNNQFSVGMPEHEAVASLAPCCKLSPPVQVDDGSQMGPAGITSGHFIFSKDGSRLLGTMYFSSGKVVRITRPIDENIDGYDTNVVAFARAMSDALSPTTGDAEITVHISVRHERLSNGGSDVLSFSLPNGLGIQIEIGTLDKPIPDTNKRDFVTLDETLEPPKRE